jgi:hypothetical protein
MKTRAAVGAQAGWWPGLMRAYRLGHARFCDWVLRELAQQAGDARLISAAALGMSQIVAGYIDQVSEEMVAAYTREREDWLLNRSAARGARIRQLLSGEPVDPGVAEATFGYRLCQYHVGLVAWAGDAAGTADEIARLEHAVGDDLHVAFGDAAKGSAGFRLTHQQALATQSVALAAGTAAPAAVTFSEVAPVAMMLGSAGLLRAWVLGTLAGLAGDDEHHARLRETLLVFLRTGEATRRPTSG